METPLQFELKDQDPWHVSELAAELIIPYLKEVGSPAAAPIATALDALSPGKRKLLDGEEREESASFLLEFWETFLRITRQVPCTHPAQDRLVALVRALASLRPEPDQPETAGTTIWADFVELENSIRFVWIEPSDAEDTFDPFVEWANLNSFVARLVGTQTLPRCWYFGFWALRWSLEHTGEPARDALEWRLATAAQWVLHDARDLRARSLMEVSGNDRRMHTSAFFEEERAFSPDRWDFWKAKLSNASQMDISADVKATVSQAIGVMEEMEKGTATVV